LEGKKPERDYSVKIATNIDLFREDMQNKPNFIKVLVFYSERNTTFTQLI